MAIKENLNAIKQELSTEEQFLENVIKGERFFKKYKKLIIILSVAGLVALSGYYATKFIEQSRINSANEAYSKLILDPNDKSALEILKQKEPSLYAVYKFKEFSQNSDTEAIKSLLKEPIDPLLKQIFSLQIADGTSELGGDYESLMKAYEYLKQDKIKEANAEFAKIDPNSPLQNLVKNLQHYQGFKK